MESGALHVGPADECHHVLGPERERLGTGRVGRQLLQHHVFIAHLGRPAVNLERDDALPRNGRIGLRVIHRQHVADPDPDPVALGANPVPVPFVRGNVGDKFTRRAGEKTVPARLIVEPAIKPRRKIRLVSAHLVVVGHPLAAELDAAVVLPPLELQRQVEVSVGPGRCQKLVSGRLCVRDTRDDFPVFHAPGFRRLTLPALKRFSVKERGRGRVGSETERTKENRKHEGFGEETKGFHREGRMLGPAEQIA